ncbi:MAG: TonB family protein [Bacteroidota bacterium]|nr:TonB family protein [Bacteroidota bacterium]
MKKRKGKDDFIKKHEYPGGTKAFREFIQLNLVYPKEALENKIEGSVFVEYEVDFKGEVKSAKILHGIGSGCDEEALRLIKLLKFAPQNNHGAKISSTHKLKINFKLPVKPATTVINYNISGTSQKKEKKKENISYTITIKHQ